MSDEVVDFDEYVENYEELLENQLSFFSSQRDYFSAYKIQLLKNALENEPKQILDFGCGIGLSLPHLVQAFPNAEIYGSDISRKSLQYVEKNFPSVKTVYHLEKYRDAFDLVFLAGVIHHVPPSGRAEVMKQIQSVIKPGGTVCIFEHNPYNPITRRIVSNCPFDKGVVLIPKRELKNLMNKAKIEPTHTAYCLFFPQSLHFLRPLEKYLKAFPLGGQYFALGKKHEQN